MTPLTPQAGMELCAHLAQIGGSVLRDYWKKGFQVEVKSGRELVTEADKAAEEAIVAELRKARPGDGILAEEGASRKADNEWTWVIDPMDGTNNFARRLPFFSVSVGLTRDGDLFAGAILEPLREELFTAGLGQGAWLDGQRLQVRSFTDLADTILATGFPYEMADLEVELNELFQILLRDTRGLRRFGSAALDLAYVAAGRLDGFWEYKLKPWDTCAGALMVREAGGVVTTLDGGDWRLDSRDVLAGPKGLVDAVVPRVRELRASGR